MPTRRSRLVPTEARGELAASLSALRVALKIPEAFAPAVDAEAADAVRSVPTSPEAAGLPDLRKIPFLTVDPEGSMDLDQALHLERTDTGAIVHYAIADVPAFVAPGGAIDAAARERGQTMYAPDVRIPLHPLCLSEDAVSLLPEQDRRAFVWRFVLDAGANPVEVTLTRAIVRSTSQWSYEDAQKAIDDKSAPPSLLALPWFGAQRAERERERGGASLNLPEARVVPEAGGYRIERSDGVPLEDWNAHLSLMTGMAAADIMLRGGIGIVRTMPPAADDDVRAFRERTVALGIPWSNSVTYGDYLRDLDRSPAALAIREYAGGLFRGAGYLTFDGESPTNAIQAAIGAPYAHTTAPLRRLVDRWSLVVCEALATGRDVPAWARESLGSVPALMNSSSQRANQLDAGAIDRIEAAVLHGREGDVFTGIVLAQRGDGARVQIAQPPVDAKVAGLSAEPGSTVSLRLDATNISDGTLSFSAVPCA